MRISAQPGLTQLLGSSTQMLARQAWGLRDPFIETAGSVWRMVGHPDGVAAQQSSHSGI